MTEIVEQKNPSCLMCANFNNLTCKAFPNGIPQEILIGENEHTKPLPDQENNIVFEPINEQE